MTTFAAALCLLLAGGCEFRPLLDPTNVSYVRVYVDETILNVTTGYYNERFYHPSYTRPAILRVGLFDTETGNLVAERYLRNQGDDELGHYYDGTIVIGAGTYDLIAYNFGTESTIVGNEYNCFGMTAFTNEISPAIKAKLKSRTKTGEDEGDATVTKADESIRYDADHLFVANAVGVTVREHDKVDTLRSTTGEPYFYAESLVKSYYIQVGIKGIQYVASSASLLTGMSRQAHPLDRDFVSGGEATLYFEMMNGTYPDRGDDYACIYTTFGTFGRLPDADNQMLVSFEFQTTYGTTYQETFPLADEFMHEDAIVHQWIIIDKVIEIPDPPPDYQGQGGLKPSVDKWGEVDSEFTI